MKKDSSDKQTEQKPNNLGELIKTGGPGRPMGSKNKIPKSLQADLKECYDRLGGVDGLVRFCKRNDKNKERFYGWVIGLLPKEVNLTGHVTHSLDKLSDQELIDIVKGQAESMKMIGQGSQGTDYIEGENNNK